MIRAVARQRLSAVFAERYGPQAVRKLEALADIIVLDDPDAASLRAALADADALLVRTYTPVTAELLESAARLKVVGRGGAGLDNVDLDAARRRGIQVVYTPQAATEAVADLTVGLLLAVARHIVAADAGVRAGRFFETREQCAGRELSELTLGIIGLGRIGRAVACRCQVGFGMTILYNDIEPVGPLDFPARSVAKEELYAASDVVSLHVPLTDATRRLLNDHTLAQFRRGALLINTARGGVVDSVALAVALTTGQLGAAALDVVDPEPLPAGHPLLGAPRAVFTPHIGARTVRALSGMNDVVDDVIRVLRGEAPRYPAWT